MEELLRLAYAVEQTASPSGLLPLYSAINQLFQDDDFDQFDQFLSELNLSKMSTLGLVGILRLSFSARDRLIRWIPFLYCTRYEIDHRGEDSELLLRGLATITFDPETIALAQAVVDMPEENLSPKEIDEWAGKLAIDICGGEHD